MKKQIINLDNVIGQKCVHINNLKANSDKKNVVIKYITEEITLFEENAIAYHKETTVKLNKQDNEMKTMSIEITKLNSDIELKNSKIIDMQLDHTSLLTKSYGIEKRIEEHCEQIVELNTEIEELTTDIEWITQEISQNEDIFFEYRDEAKVEIKKYQYRDQGLEARK